jgi:hypothetical protein
MPCPFISKVPMTDAERQARYRTMHADGAPIIRRLIGAAGSGARTIRSPRSRNSSWSMAAGWMRCRTIDDSATAEALRAIVELDLPELLAIEPPRGFGRD